VPANNPNTCGAIAKSGGLPGTPIAKLEASIRGNLKILLEWIKPYTDSSYAYLHSAVRILEVINQIKPDCDTRYDRVYVSDLESSLSQA